MVRSTSSASFWPSSRSCFGETVRQPPAASPPTITASCAQHWRRDRPFKALLGRGTPRRVPLDLSGALSYLHMAQDEGRLVVEGHVQVAVLLSASPPRAHGPR